jgi:hypothetical protein
MEERTFNPENLKLELHYDGELSICMDYETYFILLQKPDHYPRSQIWYFEQPGITMEESVKERILDSLKRSLIAVMPLLAAIGISLLLIGVLMYYG